MKKMNANLSNACSDPLYQHESYFSFKWDAENVKILAFGAMSGLTAVS